MRKLIYQANKNFILVAGALTVLILFFIGILAGGNINFNFRHHDNVVSTANYSELDAIRSQNWDFRQLSNYFSSLAKQKGGEYAYKALAYAANYNYLPPDIDTHLLGHVVGDILFNQEGIPGIKVCTDDLRNACSHSIVIGALLQDGVGELSKIIAACKLAPGGRGAYGMCVHGLGHGVLGYYEYDMRKAIELCKQTGTVEYNNIEIGQCTGGVTMEMVAGVHDPIAWAKQKNNYLSKKDPLSPCDLDFIPLSGESFCYTYLTPHLFEVAGADLGHPDPKYYHQAMAYCDQIPQNQKQNLETCFGSFGKEFVVLANSHNVQSVQSMSDDQLSLVYQWCTVSGITKAIGPCVSSALSSLYWGGENDPNVSIRFCRLITDVQNKLRCFSELTYAVSYYIQDQKYKTSYCSRIPEAYQADCHRVLVF